LGAQPKSKTHDFLLRLQCICYTPNINIANIHPLFVEWCDLNPRNSSSLEMEDDVNVVLLDSTSQDSIFSHATRNYNQDLARDRVLAKTVGAAAVQAKNNSPYHSSDKM
jgi:hypothetical protein